VGAPNTSSTTSFTLSDLSSALATPAVDGATSVIDSDPAVAPSIAGAVAGQLTAMEARVTPFKGVTIGDSNAGATDTLTITLGSGGGALIDGSGFSNLINAGGGVYTLFGAASAITSELDALVFTPSAAWPNASATTTFTLSDVSSADTGGAPAVNSTTIVIDNDPSGAISVSAAYIAANIDSINAASQVSSITLTDSGIPQLNLTDAQAEDDTSAINRIANEIFELLAPGMATTYYVGGNGATGPSLSLTASSSAVVERANSNVALTGSNDSVTIGTSSNLTVAGSNDAIAATTGDTITISSGTGETITGSGFTVYAPAGIAFAVGGNGANGTIDTVQGSNASVTLNANSHMQLNGPKDTVTMGAGSNLTVSGSNDAIAATTGDGIWVNSGKGDTIIGSGFTVQAASGTGIKVGGNGLTGPNDVVSGSNVSVGLQTSSRMTLNGSIDTVTMAAVSNLTVSGSNDTISATSGDKITISSGTGDTISGSRFTVHGGSGAGFTIVGTGDVVYAGLNDAITDGGSSTKFKAT
jgi:hypothetical protein